MECSCCHGNGVDVCSYRLKVRVEERGGRDQGYRRVVRSRRFEGGKIREMGR